MIHTLKCPSCAAPLDYDDATAKQTVRCPFCANTMVVPDNLRRHQTAPTGAAHGSFASALPKVVAIVAIALVALGAVIAYVVARRSSEPATPITHVINIPNIPNFPGVTTKDAKQEPSVAELALRFGSEGIGQGNFKDARHIAVDGEGRIYVAEYIGGRVQVFDPEGKFLALWMVDPKMPLRGFTADRKGVVYVVQQGKIRRHEGLTGNPLGEVTADRARFDDAKVTADGGLVTSARIERDDIIRFDSSGRAVKTIRSAISTQTDRSELDIRVAADGLGNIYALGTFNDAVFKFTPEGRYVNTFGGQGDQPGQFRSPDAIAVDNQGRVFVSDARDVDVFDPNGRFITSFKVDGIASGIVFNDRNELLIAARTEVLKYRLNKF